MVEMRIRKGLGILMISLIFLSAIVVYMSPQVSHPVNTIPKSQNMRIAQNYYFKLKNESVHVYPKSDGSIDINYTIVFENHGDPIDVIDIGFPNQYYKLDSVHARWYKDGTWYDLTDIRPSTYIDIGVEVHIPSSIQIHNGEVGTLVIWGNNPHMIYQDTEKPDYVGYEFSPTWFSSDFCFIVDHMYTFLHFPEGFYNRSETYYHREAPDIIYNDSKSVVFVYHEEAISPHQYTYGISFPKKYVNTFYTEQPAPPIDIDDLMAMFFVFLTPILFFGCICCGCISNRRRKGKYMPPAVRAETLGIHRGLTAVEAAVLMEVPLQRVFTMIIFGMLKKGLIEVIPGKPPRFKKKDIDLKQARARYYERAVLRAIDADGYIDKKRLSDALILLVETVADKMEGYSRKQTKAYYKKMIERAFREIAAAGAPEIQEKAFNEYAEWLLVADKPKKYARGLDVVYVPRWYWSIHTIGSGKHISPGFSGSSRGSSSDGGQPISISNFADSFVSGVEGFANTAVVGFSGIADAIVNIFNPPPTTGGGGGGGCACACASCACACAGGGR